MGIRNRQRAVLWRLLFFFWLARPVHVAAAPSTLFDRSLQQLETKIKSGAAAGEFTFVVMGDSRDNDEVFARILALAASYRPLFVLHNGDVVNSGTREEYAHFLEVLHTTVPDMPFFVVAGNHELKKKGGKLFAAEIAPLDYVLEPAGTGIRIVALNNAGYSLTPDQLRYLDRELAREEKLNLVIMHIPPRTGRWNTDHFFSRGAGELCRILADRKVPLAFFGHEHLYDEDRIDGVRYIVTGGAGAPLYSTGFGDPSYHFIVVKVKDKTVSAEVVRLRR